jgi:uncharacterized protein YpbB
MKMDIPVKQNEIESEAKITTPKTESKLVSLQLFKNGKSTIDIAKERGMATSTIEEHLAHYVENGELEIEKLVSPEKKAMISNWYLQNPTPSLGPAKAELGEAVTYSDLRFVLKYLVYTKQITV